MRLRKVSPIYSKDISFRYYHFRIYILRVVYMLCVSQKPFYADFIFYFVKYIVEVEIKILGI